MFFGEVAVTTPQLSSAFRLSAVCAAVALTLIACGDSQPTAEEKAQLDQGAVRGACENSVKNQLKDPGSAQFGNENVNDHPTATPPSDLEFDAAAGDRYFIVLGTINAKNSMGGYTGAKPFGCDAKLTKDGHATGIAKIIDA